MIIHVGWHKLTKIVFFLLQAKNEVKVLNSLNHPNIVKYYECYQERNMMHIIMEFCQVCPFLLFLSCASSCSTGRLLPASLLTGSCLANCAAQTLLV